MAASPVWFGPPDRPLFGWFHTPPTGTARAAAVVCPPFVREHLQVHYALRVLAEELESRGIATLRFDYDGMGDSAGSTDDPGRLSAWLGSIAAAAELARDAGPRTVCLVGMRIGATLAARAAADIPAVDQLVLWDPCPSGRQFLREQRVMGALTPAGARTLEDGSLDAPGLVLRPETLGELRNLRLDAVDRPVARRVLVLARADRPLRPGVTAGLGSESTDHGEAVGQAALMDTAAPWQALPGDDIHRIAGWISRGAARTAAPVRTVPAAGPAVVARDGRGRPVVERPLSVGPAGLFGMVTMPAGAVELGTARGGEGRGGAVAAATGSPEPVTVFLNVANGHHIGPSRLWVDLARRWAGHGITSLRLDLSGLGESPVRSPGQQPFVVRAPESFPDLADAVRAVSPDDPRRVVLVGLCASAYQVIDSALELCPWGVVSLNPVLTFVPPELARHLPLDPRRRAALPRTPVIGAFHDTGRLSPLRRRFPRLAWRARLWSHPERRASRWLRELVGGGTDLFLLAGEREARPILYGSSARLRSRLARTGRFRFEHLPDLDHGLLVGAQRAAVADLVTEHLLARLSLLAPATDPPPPGEARPGRRRPVAGALSDRRDRSEPPLIAADR